MEHHPLRVPHKPGAPSTRDTQPQRHPKRLTSAARRTQLLEIATAQFTQHGLCGTTTRALVTSAGITQPVLYSHFGSKRLLFQATVENNMAQRLRELEVRLARIKGKTPEILIRAMAEATVAVCLSSRANATLMSWALLELPEYADELCRKEEDSIVLLWEHELSRRSADSRTRAHLSRDFVSYAVDACLAYGVWLAAHQHTLDTAAQLARRFAAGVARQASAILK